MNNLFIDLCILTAYLHMVWSEDFAQYSVFGGTADPDIKGGLTTRFDPPPNGLRELKLHRSSTNVCTKTKMFLKIFFDIRFRSEGA